MGGVAEQDHVLEVPARALHGLEADPARAVREQRRPTQLRREELLAVGDALLGARRVEAGSLPGLLVGLDDDRARLRLELIGVDLEDAVVVVAEAERERLEARGRAEPDVGALARLHARLEVIGPQRASLAVDPVGADQEIGLRLQPLEVLHLGPEGELDAEISRALLQDLEEPLPGHAAEAVATAADARVTVVDVDGVPVGERLGDAAIDDRVRLLEVAERLVAEDHAPAEGVVGRVALDDVDVVRRLPQLEQDGRVEPAGSATEDLDAQRVPPTPSPGYRVRGPPPRRSLTASRSRRRPRPGRERPPRRFRPAPRGASPGACPPRSAPGPRGARSP